MRCTAAVATLAALMSSPACTIYHVTVEQTVDEDETGLDSYPGYVPPPPADASSSGGAMEGESTGADTSSSGDETTGGMLDGSTGTTGEDESTVGASTGGEIGSTGGGGSTSTDTSGSTGTSDASGGDEPPLKKLGEMCTDDSQCESAWCTTDIFEDGPNTCTTTCTIDSANSCKAQGAPGLCVQGGDKLYCSGSMVFGPGGYLIMPETEPPNLIGWAGSSLLADALELESHLIPPQPYPFLLTTSHVNDVGYGAAALDVYAANGTPLGTVVKGSPLVVQPDGKHTLIVARAIEGKKSLYWLYINTAP